MIEFIIPQNLPVRAIAVTGANEEPPAWIAAEIARRASRLAAQRDARAKAEQAARSAEAERLVEFGPPAPPPQQIETELLREQRAVFQRVNVELQQTKQQLEQNLQAMLDEVRRATVELAHAVAAKLVFEAVDEGRFPIENLVHEVLSRVETNLPVNLRLHPDDLAYLQQLAPIESMNGPGTGPTTHVNYIADDTLARGDCKAQAGDVQVAYLMHHHAEEIRKQLLATVPSHAEA